MKTKIDENAAIAAIEQVCPGLDYILILHNPDTREVIQVSNVPPEVQKKAMRHNLKSMEDTEPEMVRPPQIHKH
jgi:hypothetical protein